MPSVRILLPYIKCIESRLYMAILVLGASGTVGSALVRCLAGQYDITGTYNTNKQESADGTRWFQYDVADRDTLHFLLDEIKPEWIISSLRGDFETQLSAHSQISAFLNKTSGRCIYISTANVFDGSPDSIKVEGDTPYAISEYGRYKLCCEQMLQQSLGDRCLIIRLPRILTPQRIQDEVKQVEKSRIEYSNLFMSYNTAENVAKAISYCIETNRSGILHLTSNDAMLAIDFNETVLSRLGKSISYTASALSVETYCQLLGCDDPSLLHYTDNGFFNLALKSTDRDMVTRFGDTCEHIISTVIGT